MWNDVKLQKSLKPNGVLFNLPHTQQFRAKIGPESISLLVYRKVRFLNNWSAEAPSVERKWDVKVRVGCLKISLNPSERFNKTCASVGR
ncbi:hypothetical protein NPIL_283901 [Nephila pilipes]|uniref:Uncharacterized protein n=1 Tax=Nephila pilipes TaxID=299642 RepID=A0A8X6IRT3_NEPPI|nr:hypothetical protein NPIL_283901 [Nephila pilipes]